MALPARLLTLSEAMIQLEGSDDNAKGIRSSDLPNHFVSEIDIRGLKDAISEARIKLRYKRADWLGQETSRALRPFYRQPFHPNQSQLQAIREILADSEDNRVRNYLLYGITGSGKTLVYLEVMRAVIERGGSVLALVPEISLTPVMEKIFIDAFGERVLVLHSRLKESERFRRWEQARSGKCGIVLGPRSAVLVPMKNLGMIIVDEEQDGSYKQETHAPKYNARDVAIMRGQIESIPVILGSATPSIESYHNTRSGKYKLLTLPERPEGGQLPVVTVLDMRKERTVSSSLSATLVTHINDSLLSGKQTLLLLNRRGYARYVQCHDCGKMWRCPDCDINYTYHEKTEKLVCHYCGKTETPSEICPICQSPKISLFGVGTQRLEKTLNELFPDTTISRMDLDSTRASGELERIIDDVTAGKVDILVGTQMVGKGFDFPNIHLTGIIMIDLSLSFPDFRARENTFRLLTQAAGRAGRRSTAGEVIIQSFTPDEYSIYYAGNQDFEGFYEEEIGYRRKMFYPPFTKLVLFTISSMDQVKAARYSQILKNKLIALKDGYSGRLYRLLGPAPAPLYKLRKYYRYQLLLKLDSILKFNMALRKYYPSAPAGIIPRNIKLSIDVDPQDMM